MTFALGALFSGEKLNYNWDLERKETPQPEDPSLEVALEGQALYALGDKPVFAAFMDRFVETAAAGDERRRAHLRLRLGLDGAACTVSQVAQRFGEQQRPVRLLESAIQRQVVRDLAGALDAYLCISDFASRLWRNGGALAYAEAACDVVFNFFPGLTEAERTQAVNFTQFLRHIFPGKRIFHDDTQIVCDKTCPCVKCPKARFILGQLMATDRGGAPEKQNFAATVKESVCTGCAVVRTKPERLSEGVMRMHAAYLARKGDLESFA